MYVYWALKEHRKHQTCGQGVHSKSSKRNTEISFFSVSCIDLLLLHCDIIELYHIGRMIFHISRMCDVQANSLDFQTGNKNLTRAYTRTKTLLSGSQKEKKQNVHLKCLSLNTLDNPLLLCRNIFSKWFLCDGFCDQIIQTIITTF